MGKEMEKGLLCMALVGSVLFLATGNTIASANEPLKIQPAAPKDEVWIQPVVSKEDQYRTLSIKDEVSIMPIEKISKEFLEKVKGASGIEELPNYCKYSFLRLSYNSFRKANSICSSAFFNLLSSMSRNFY